MRSIASLALVVLVSVGSVGSVGCGRTRDARARTDSGAPPPPRGEVEIASVAVAGDEPVLVVAGNPSVRRPIVYLHGMCSKPRGKLQEWGGAAKQHGTILALTGDVPCPDKPGTTKWTDEISEIDSRITAAIAAVNTAHGGAGAELDAREVVIVGESMGAARAESLAKENPARYTRLVLVGSPRVASPANLRSARAVANLAGEHESQQIAKSATRALANAGLAAQFWEIDNASHAQYGPDGERIMGEALAFVAAR